jgi:hypothetical protein
MNEGEYRLVLAGSSFEETSVPGFNFSLKLEKIATLPPLPAISVQGV